MPRPNRLSGNDLYFHVFARGNNKQQIFFEPADYRRFLSNLERFRQIHLYKLYAYCLMPNHFHLLLQTHGAPLSKTMQVLMTAYSMYANRKFKHIGHLFQGRFQSIIVDRETYFLQVLRYIHLNPVEAHLVDLPETYPWSSYQHYIKSTPNEPIVECDEVLPFFSSHEALRPQAFQEFTLAGIREPFDPFKKQTRGILGSAKFHMKMTKVLHGVRP